MKAMTLLLALGFGLLASNLGAQAYLRKITKKVNQRVTVFRAEDGMFWTVGPNTFTVIEGGQGKDYISWCKGSKTAKPMEIRLGDNEGKVVKKFCQGADSYGRSCAPKDKAKKCDEGPKIREYPLGAGREFGVIISGNPNNPDLELHKVGGIFS